MSPQEFGAAVSLVQTIADLGATGFLLLAIYGYATGRVRSGSLVDAERARDEAEIAGWKDIANKAVAALADLTGAVNRLTETIRELRSEVVRLRELVRQLGGKP